MKTYGQKHIIKSENKNKPPKKNNEFIEKPVIGNISKLNRNRICVCKCIQPLQIDDVQICFRPKCMGCGMREKQTAIN